MNYYLIFLFQGKVVNICSYDEQDSRDREQARFADMLKANDWYSFCDGVQFDTLQTLDQVR